MKKIERLTTIFRELQIIASLLTDKIQELSGIPSAQFHVLAHLLNTTNQGESPSDLARLFRVSKPAMTQLIQRMRKKGWLLLEPISGDERRKQVSITKLGANTHKKSMDLVLPQIERLANLMNRQELEHLFEQLHKLRIAAEKEALN